MEEGAMSSLNAPAGDDRVAVGTKSKTQNEKGGFAAHKSGKHAESDYVTLGKSPSPKKSIKPDPQNPQQGGRNAKVR
jgi:hypothetical protein